MKAAIKKMDTILSPVCLVVAIAFSISQLTSTASAGESDKKADTESAQTAKEDKDAQDSKPAGKDPKDKKNQKSKADKGPSMFDRMIEENNNKSGRFQVR